MKRVVKNGQTGSRQSYKNSKKFDPNKYKLEKEKIPNDVVNCMTSLCCKRCCDIISWKVDYGKYEVLQRARKCNLCSEKKITLAYHRICQDCAKENVLCAKCQKPPYSEFDNGVEESDNGSSCTDVQKDSISNKPNKYGFLDEVADPDVAFLRGLDSRMVLRSIQNERYEIEKEKLSRLRERERRTVLRNNCAADDSLSSDEEVL